MKPSSAEFASELGISDEEHRAILKKWGFSGESLYKWLVGRGGRSALKDTGGRADPWTREEALEVLHLEGERWVSVPATTLRRHIRTADVGAAEQPGPKSPELHNYGAVEFQRFAARELVTFDRMTAERARLMLDDIGPGAELVDRLRKLAAQP